MNSVLTFMLFASMGRNYICIEVPVLFFKFVLSIFTYRHGAPKSILTDQGREFVNSTSEHLFYLTNIKHKMTSAYHPQCNGLIERYNQTLQRSLLKLVSEKQDDCDMFLDGVLFAYRTSVHKSTGFTPFELMYCRYENLMGGLCTKSFICSVI